jgi:plasmid replication initiation protein
MSHLFSSPSPPLQIRQHNTLTTARYNYTELQTDFLFFLLSKLRNDQHNVCYRLPIAELSSLTGKRYNYPYLHQATKDMGSRMFEVKTDNLYRQIWMFQSIEYIENQAIIEVTLSEKVLPLLFDVKKNFTSYELHAALRLTSKHAKRIYPICSQWKDKGQTPLYPLRDFKLMLGLINPTTGKEEYPLFGSLKQYILSPAIKQINAETDLKVRLVVTKIGRAVAAIGFEVSFKPSDLPIQFGGESSPTSAAPEGIAPHQVEKAAQILDEMRISREGLRHQILSSAAKIREVLAFSFDLRTQKVKATSNAGGLLLVKLGLAPMKSRTTPGRPANRTSI